MDSGEARTICIVRRMKRKSLSMFTLRGYNPVKASPEELRFDLLDGNEKSIGRINYGKITLTKGTELTTPWGEGKIEYVKGGVKVALGVRDLVTLKGGLFKKGFDLVFPTGTMMSFLPVKGRRNDIEYSGERGFFGVYEEKGSLPEGQPSSTLIMTKEEIMALPKSERPRSIETREYVQFRMKSSGDLPVRTEDVVSALCIFTSYGCVVSEIPS